MKTDRNLILKSICLR